MEFELSEWGKKHTEFKDLESAIKYCEDNNFLDGERAILWIIGNNRIELNRFRVDNKNYINFEYMRLKYKGRVNWVWDSIDNKWYDYDSSLDESRYFNNEKIVNSQPTKITFLEKLALRIIKKRINSNRNLRVGVYKIMLEHFCEKYYEDNLYTSIYGTASEYFDAMLSSLDFDCRNDKCRVEMLKRGIMNEFDEVKENKHFKID